MYTQRHGKVTYLEIPATDPRASADFYRRVFGWSVRERGNGVIAFDDTLKEVSGAFVTGRTSSTDAGVVIYIMVDDAEKTMAALREQNAEILQPLGFDPPELTAWFADRAGNRFGIYQKPE